MKPFRLWTFRKTRCKAGLRARRPFLSGENPLTPANDPRRRRPRSTSILVASSTAVLAVVMPKCIGCLLAYLAIASGLGWGGKELCSSPLVETSFSAEGFLPHPLWFAPACGLMAAALVGISRMGRSSSSPSL